MLTRKESNVGLLGVKGAPRQATDFLAIKLQVVQLRHRDMQMSWGLTWRQASTMPIQPEQCALTATMGTHPIVPTHWVKAVGATDEHQVIVPRHQHFDEIVALVLCRRGRVGWRGED